ncbi:MAG: LexA family transcriptional regulator [Chitinophagales bacterium]|jgi:transcriptional regulator with XRE-family HTH domain|nr:LexA family transcriptional regulator [Sphingobacteriales bacterium]MBP7534150.1 LexA family transcriptional regulator [Chitinophagales bacterium]
MTQKPKNQKTLSLAARNLKLIRAVLGLTQSEWAEQIGSNSKTVGAYEQGTQKPQLEHLQAAAAYLGVPLERLLYEDLCEIAKLSLHSGDSLDKLIQEYVRLKGTNMKTRTVAMTLNLANQSNVELVAAKAAAGYTAGYADPEYLKDLMHIYLPFLSSDRTYRAFEVTGDSMLPVEAGDIIVGEYVQDLTDLKNNQTYIVVSRDGIVYKRVKTLGKDDFNLTLCSDNDAYKPYKIHKKEVLEIWRECASIRRQS